MFTIKLLNVHSIVLFFFIRRIAMADPRLDSIVVRLYNSSSRLDEILIWFQMIITTFSWTEKLGTERRTDVQMWSRLVRYSSRLKTPTIELSLKMTMSFLILSSLARSLSLWRAAMLNSFVMASCCLQLVTCWHPRRFVMHWHSISSGWTLKHR